MTSRSQERLLEEFAAIFPGRSMLFESLARDPVGQLAQAALTTAGTDVRPISSLPSEDGNGEDTGSLALAFFKSGFGAAPLISGLISLFGGGSDPEPTPLERYVMPSPISFASADTGRGLAAMDFDQTGSPRIYRTAADDPGRPTVDARRAAPQITVNVQTIDAQSFLDHSAKIAQAVRGAMLNLSSLNDVVNEL